MFSSFLSSHAHHLDLPSFPTRRSSDLAIDDRRHRIEQWVLGQIQRTALSRQVVELPALHRLPNHVLDHVGACYQNNMDSLEDRKSTRLNSSHTVISYAVFCLKKKNKKY